MDDLYKENITEAIIPETLQVQTHIAAVEINIDVKNVIARGYLLLKTIEHENSYIPDSAAKKDKDYLPLIKKMKKLDAMFLSGHKNVQPQAHILNNHIADVINSNPDRTENYSKVLYKNLMDYSKFRRSKSKEATEEGIVRATYGIAKEEYINFDEAKFNKYAKSKKGSKRFIELGDEISKNDRYLG